MESNTNQSSEQQPSEHQQFQSDIANVESYYHHLRPGVIEAVKSVGGTAQDGATFFRASLLHVLMANPDRVIDQQDYLNTLAQAHYEDWKKDIGKATDGSELIAPFSTDQRLQLRQWIKAKRSFSQLSATEREEIGMAANILHTGGTVDSVNESAVANYKKILGSYAAFWADPLPDWAVTSITSPEFDQHWQLVEATEKKYTSTKEQSKKATALTQIIKTALLIFAVGTLGYILWNKFMAPASVKEVYADNFNPPASIAEDLKLHPVISPDDSIEVSRPSICDDIINQADALYKEKKWRPAAQVLMQMVGSPEYEVCNSEALFYLGIIGLKIEDPYLTLECMAKIEDLERFGEDLYWYQALAFVKIATLDASEKEYALEAVERAMSNTEIPERREQCIKMIEQLK